MSLDIQIRTKKIPSEFSNIRKIRNALKLKEKIIYKIKMYANEKQNGKFEHTKITATTILVETQKYRREFYWENDRLPFKKNESKIMTCLICVYVCERQSERVIL